MKAVVVPFFISHLGCPHRCVFCDQEKIAGARGELPEGAEIVEKVERYRETARGRTLEVAFYGGTFTSLPKNDQELLLGALQPLLTAGHVASIRLSTRPDAVDRETAAFLKKMGVSTVELGVQSMDEEVLALSHRGHSSSDVEAAVRVLQQAELRVGVQLMPGLPGDTAEKSLAVLTRVLSLKPDFLRIYPTLVIAGTDLSRLYHEGKYSPLSLDEAVSLCKRMLSEARRAGVPVVRLGLQPTAELESSGVVLAGPYHPAFGQLVESELYYDLMSEMVRDKFLGSKVRVTVSPGRISDVVGQKRRNIERLKEYFGVCVTEVREDPALEPGAVRLERE